MGAILDTPWIGQQYSPPTPIDIATIETAIVTRLQAMVTSIDVVHFPAPAKEYRMTSAVGAALVTFRRATYAPVEDTAAIIQERKLEFDITLLVRDLGWSVGGPPSGVSPGSYALMESIRAALTGYRVPGARKIFLVSEKFLERDSEGAVWTYLISVALTTIAVEPSTVPEFPLFIKGVAEESGDETTVTIGATEFTFNSQDQIQLPNGNLIAVTVSAIGGGAFVIGTDFTIDAVNGIVTRVATGTIASGATVNVAWSYGDSVIASAGESSPTL
jgi:hypothetical protein